MHHSLKRLTALAAFFVVMFGGIASKASAQAARPQQARVAYAHSGASERAIRACHSANAWIDLYDLLHIRLIHFEETVNWCDNGTSLTSYNSSTFCTAYMGWRCLGIVYSHRAGGVGSTYVDLKYEEECSWKQGPISLWSYPWVEIRGNAGGSYRYWTGY